MTNRRSLISLLLFCAVANAQDDPLNNLNAKIERLNNQHKEREIKDTLSKLDALNPPKVAIAPQTPVSPIPVPGQSAPLVPAYPSANPGDNHKEVAPINPNINQPQPSVNIYR